MTERQTWVVIALAVCVVIGVAVWLGVDLPAVGRAILWVVELAERVGLVHFP